MKIRDAVALLVCVLASTSAFTEEAAKPPEAPGKVKVSFSGMDLASLAQQVERATKKSFLYQEDLLKNKKVSLESPTPISPEELYRVFQSICLMNGLVLVPVEGAEIDLVKIVQTNQGSKEPGAQPVLVRGEALPGGDTLVYYLLTAKNISPAKAMNVLSPALSSTGIVQQVANSDLILVIDVATAIRRAERLLALVDQPGAPVVNVAVALQHLLATQAKAQLADFTQALEKAATGETGRGKLATLVDERLNTLHLIGPLREVDQARDFLKEIDRDLPSAKRVVGYYRLKNVPVMDVADTIRELLGMAIEARRTAERRAPARPSPLAGRPTRELAGAPVPTPAASPPEGPPPEAAPPPGAHRPGMAGGAAEPPKGDVEIVPMEGLNTLVVIGDQAMQDEVKNIISQIDRRKGQVLIEVAIIQVTGDDSLDTGIETLFQDPQNNGARVNVGTGFGLGAQADPGGGGFPTAQTLTSFTGAAARYLKPDEISTLLRVVATRSNVNIVSQPLLLVNDNEEANFTTKVSEPTTAISQGTATTTTSFAGFAEAVTSLKITPQVSPGPNGYVNLRISQDFEEFTGASTPGSGVPPPKVSNSVTTRIAVPDRHTVILGGFTRDSATESRSGIPGLMEVPILKYAFSHESVRVTKSRLYLFCRPRILSTEGFQDLENTSGEKLRDVERFTEGSRIEAEVKEALLPIEEGAPPEKR